MTIYRKNSIKPPDGLFHVRHSSGRGAYKRRGFLESGVCSQNQMIRTSIIPLQLFYLIFSGFNNLVSRYVDSTQFLSQTI